MISRSRCLRSIALGTLALGAMGVTPALASGHDVYPPGWNKPSDPGPVIYTWDPIDLSMKRVPGAPELKPAYGPVIYQFTPQSLRMHRVN